MQTDDSLRYTVIFLHCVRGSDSILDLLFYSEASVIQSLVNKDFNEACTILKNKFSSRIVEDRIVVFKGSTQLAFRNFLEANHVDEILVPSEYRFKAVHKKSFDPTPFILKSGLTITEVSWNSVQNAPEKNQLAELFST
jgi:hypothetical protein